MIKIIYNNNWYGGADRMRTPNEELVQKGQNIYAVDSDGKERFVAELRSASIHAFMEDDGFYVVKSIPYTNFF